MLILPHESSHSRNKAVLFLYFSITSYFQLSWPIASDMPMSPPVLLQCQCRWTIPGKIYLTSGTRPLIYNKNDHRLREDLTLITICFIYAVPWELWVFAYCFINLLKLKFSWVFAYCFINLLKLKIVCVEYVSTLVGSVLQF